MADPTRRRRGIRQTSIELERPIYRSWTSALRRNPIITSALRDAPMPTTVMVNQPRSRTTRYSMLDRYNTQNSKLYWKSGAITQTAVNTAEDVELQLPVVVQNDGTAIAIELMRFDYVLAGWEDTDGRRYQMCYVFVDSTGTDHRLSNDDTFVEVTHVQDLETPLAGSLTKEKQHNTVDLSDGAGHGMQCVANKLTVRYNTSGFTAVAGPFQWRLVYKIIVMDTDLFAGLRQHQTNR